MLRVPLVFMMKRVYLDLVQLGLPRHHPCYCIAGCGCCCLCCCTARRMERLCPTAHPALYGPDAVLGEEGAQPPRCCLYCEPYLPFVVAALRPLAEISLLGLATLTAASVSFGPVSWAIHVLGAYAFFYGSISLHGFWIYTQRAVCARWGTTTARDILGFDLTSARYRTHTRLFAYQMLFVVEQWVSPSVTFAIGRSTGKMAVYNFYMEYCLALSQWTIILLIVASGVALAHDAEALPRPDHDATLQHPSQTRPEDATGSTCGQGPNQKGRTGIEL